MSKPAVLLVAGCCSHRGYGCLRRGCGGSRWGYGNSWRGCRCSPCGYGCSRRGCGGVVAALGGAKPACGRAAAAHSGTVAAHGDGCGCMWWGCGCTRRGCGCGCSRLSLLKAAAGLSTKLINRDLYFFRIHSSVQQSRNEAEPDSVADPDSIFPNRKPCKHTHLALSLSLRIYFLI